MAAIIPKTYFLAAKKQIGAAAGAIQAYNYSQRPKVLKNPTTASLKRGTGGRSSFNGIVCTIFGNSGMIGKQLAFRLARMGTQLILPHRCDYYDVQELKVAGDLGQIYFHPFDLRDEESILKCIKYSNVVINLIGREWETKNFKFHDVNVEGVATLARLCKQSGVERFIHMSCLNAHPDPKPIVMKNGSQYLKSKWEGEVAIRKEFPEATIIRPSDVYCMEDRFLGAFAHRWKTHFRKVPLYKKGEETEKQPVFIGDVLSGIVAIVKDPSTAGRTYQFIGPNRYKLSDFVDWIHEIIRRESVEYGYGRIELNHAPLYKLKVNLTEMISPAYPLGFLSWENLERQHTSDRVIKGVPTLEDLGVNPIPPDTQVPYELLAHKLDGYYQASVGEFPDIIPPKPVPPKTVYA